MSSSHDTAKTAANHAAPNASDHASDHAAHDLPHEGPIRTPKQLIWAVVASFVIPIAAIILMVNYVNVDNKPAAGSTGLGSDAVAKRLQRVGSVEVRDAATAVARSGEAVTQGVCAACHSAGLAGAPKIGDVAAWAPRVKTGYEALLNSALKGKGAMGAQGGGDYTDEEIARAVVYMANQSGAKFDEPKSASAATTAATTSATTSATTAQVAAPAAAPAAPK